MKKILVLITLVSGNAFANPITLPIDLGQASEGLTRQQKATKVQVDLNKAMEKARITATVGFSTCGNAIKEAEQTLGATTVKDLDKTFCLRVGTKSMADMIRVRNALKLSAGQEMFAREGFLVRITLR